MKAAWSGGAGRLLLAFGGALVVMALIDGHFAATLAQSPFGAPKGPSGSAVAAETSGNGIVAWLLAKQAEFYRAMSGTIRAARNDGSAVWTLLGISFLYGVFHAAGPGHGKAVIASYLVANEETARRGIVLSFASAMLQALVAVMIVGVCAWLLNVTAQTMCSTERVIEILSYGLIMVVGLRLMWGKGRGLWRALPIGQPAPRLAMAGATAHASGVHHHHGHDHGHGHGHGHGHDHAHDHHDENCGCGHSHGPDPSQLAGPGGWRHGLTAVLSVGIRPCSGAILVLIFALAQGMFLAGIAATFVMGIGTALTVTGFAILAVSAKGLARRVAAARGGTGTVLVRVVEFGAAALVACFGLALMLGYMAAERTTCF